LLFIGRGAERLGTPADINEAKAVERIDLVSVPGRIARGEIVGAASVVGLLAAMQWNEEQLGGALPPDRPDPGHRTRPARHPGPTTHVGPLDTAGRMRGGDEGLPRSTPLALPLSVVGMWLARVARWSSAESASGHGQSCRQIMQRGRAMLSGGQQSPHSIQARLAWCLIQRCAAASQQVSFGIGGAIRRLRRRRLNAIDRRVFSR
jgi:hypothetical protein